MRKFILILLFLVSIQTVNAATIHGTIYDWATLQPVNALVEVDSTPKQSMVAINGQYSFELPPGDYNIDAVIFGRESRLRANETITITQDGSYVLDLILFPSLLEEDELTSDENINFDTSILQGSLISPILVIIIVILLFLGIYLFSKKRIKVANREGVRENEIKEKIEQIKKEDADLDKLVDIIRKYGGRVTQKQIRKELPLSEAKVSLMISELEHNGTIKKIKKGRGNILILVRN